MPDPGPVPIHVLLIEDSPEDAELILMELRRGGLSPNAKRVETAEQLTHALRQRQWDLILCDYTMPELTVEAALDAVREGGVEAPFVITSATIVDEAAVAAMKAGAHDIATKQNLSGLLPVIEREMRDCELRSMGKNVGQEREKC